MTAKTLEEEAREAAEAYRESCSLGAVGERQLHDEVIGYGNGYLAAATLRDKENAQLRTSLMLTGANFDSAVKEIEELRARVKVLEGMVPKWVPVAQKIALDIQGWLPIEDQKCGDSERQWLMVPPIPLPGEGG